MKNAIRILLYLLLALLVIAIAVIIYKRSKTPTDDVPTTSELADSLFMDHNQVNQTALNGEDSMILDMTGQLPTQVGPPATTVEDQANKEKQQSINKNTDLDYSKPVNSTEQTAAENTSPKAQKVSENSSGSKAEPAVIKKTVSKPVVKNPSSSNSGFYVISGSFIVPSHADDQVKKLKKLGYKGANRKVFGSSEYYSAVVGSYSSRTEAQKVVNTLQGKGEKAFLKAR